MSAASGSSGLMAAIETRQLAKQFGEMEALAPLDLVVPRGSVFALVGHNGAGKTTLIKLLLNMVKPTSGEATVLGKPVAELKGAAFRDIGYVSESQEMPEWMTVEEWMEYLRPFYPQWDDTDLLRDLDLPPDREIQHLSRGMRMKTMLASVLAFRPPLIVMDEPFSGLDPLVRDELIETLMDHLSSGAEGESGTTILICSHDLAEIETFATHVAFLHEGRLLFAESMESLLARFREVTVTLAGEGDVPKKFPKEWLVVERSGPVVRFVHGSAEGEIRGLLPPVETIEYEPMNLRKIFLALVKSKATRERRRA
jgi:ABC-2 type transport system ATP-binding protein